MRLWLFALAWALLTAAGLAAESPLSAETASQVQQGRFVFSGWEGPDLPVWYQLPERVSADTPVVIVMHGVNRDADRYRNEWAELAQQHGFMVLVPEFGAKDFPGSRGYNTGYFVNAYGSPRPRAQWSFAALEPLFVRPDLTRGIANLCAGRGLFFRPCRGDAVCTSWGLRLAASP